MTEPLAKPVITQAMIDAYDEYTHLTLDRRRFMEQLTTLAGSGAAAAAIAPILAANSAKAAIVAEDEPRVKGEDITFPGSSGEMKAYLVRPADRSGKVGTVIVIHENRGLNPHIRDVARRVALEGFVALAPDFLSPLGGTPADEDKARDMFTKLDPAQVVADGVATVAYLKGYKDGNGKVGAVGFCWGGGTVNTLAVNAPDLSAGVAYYGMQPKAEDVPKIKAALLLHYAGLDERIDAGIDAYKKALDAAHVEYTVYVYDGVNHAFNNDTSAARYDKKAADLAWGRTIAFLKEKLV
ncbi:MAG: dienelactone hydrolase family protein [Mesorhizobium sp.]|uniref:dienelactone hydrolase family protein n=1 Tax=unclassified Mesorhizobium TaxID=325217 RepID=UPI000F751BC9|nr:MULTISPECIES: dienelactone hydrolase family protein [unclassified Mesorhizobium]AZO74697.1 dienelactone hydrolase family protein [Mesorhizobium sp. M1D.F.Ca.ET.043.01.1.1]RWA96436.1 MAG: dienelactone hydrolase family protein [Mesorhizobium sp.]RWE05580.1 MAG: dienelactone hydrolase family protein [Mesorhizobium sp.]TIV99646.1 MAG: dienelactone hydrolase family protein [Mesorhizobium sp.]TJW86869.1 MAG: dienelactone hydrolase family protein [Mesorhizobium sp.]